MEQFRRAPPRRYESDASIAMSETSESFSLQFGAISGASYADDDDEESFNTSFDVASHNSFNTNLGQKIDDTSLALLIGKLKGGAQIGENTDEAPPGTDDASAGSSSSGSENLEDDDIAMHLKALANLTTKKRSPFSAPSADERNEPLDASSDDDDEETDDEDAESEEEDDEDEAEEVDDVSLEGPSGIEVDEVIEKLGVKTADEFESEEAKRSFLESVALSGQAHDLGETTLDSQKLWHAQLAWQLLDEDSSSDDESKVTVGVTAHNIDSLARVQQSAEKLISADQKQQEKMSNWRAQQRSKQVITPPSPKAPRPGSKSRTLQPVDTNGSDRGSRDNSNDVDSVFTPVHKLVPGDNYGMPWAFALAESPKEKPLEVVIPISASKRKQTRKSRPNGIGMVHGNRNAVLMRKERLPPRPSNLKGQRRVPNMSLSTVEEGDPKVPTSIGTARETETKKGAAQQANKKVRIPSGYPPYPGYGAKWPYHPYSPKAPAEYKQSYMHHMGEHYFQYMEFFRNRDENSDKGMDEADEILRKANFDNREENKPKPTMSPYTFTSNPGKARKNSVVPVGMARIQEASVSSGSTVKKVPPTKAADVRVGKHHQKSKGKRGKVVVRSGAELEKKAHMEKKKPKNAKNASPAASKEQPSGSVPSTTDQQCACTIM